MGGLSVCFIVVWIAVGYTPAKRWSSHLKTRAKELPEFAALSPAGFHQIMLDRSLFGSFDHWLQIDR